MHLKYLQFKMHLAYWFLHWVVDEDGDIGAAFFGGSLIFIKYKYTWICHVGKPLPQAEKNVKAKSNPGPVSFM